MNDHIPVITFHQEPSHSSRIVVRSSRAMKIFVVCIEVSQIHK